jgi:transcriptional regulator with XRE-family HTH domain
MPEHETTVRSRELGEELRRVLEKAELTGLEVARQLGWSQSDVSRMLTGKGAVKEADVATLLGICRVKDRERARLSKLCQEANKRGWWQQYGSRLPKQLRTLIDHEDKFDQALGHTIETDQQAADAVQKPGAEGTLG